MKLTAREKKLLIILGVVICIFAYFKFIFLPEGQRIAALKQELAYKRLLVTNADSSEVLLEDASRKLKELDGDLRKYENSLAGSIHAPMLLEELITRAGKLEVDVYDINFEGNSAVVKGQYVEDQGSGDITLQSDTLYELDSSVFSFSFEGSYQACMKLISYYETSKDYFMIEQLDLSQNTGKCTGEIRIKAYAIKKQDGYDYNMKASGERDNPFR